MDKIKKRNSWLYGIVGGYGIFLFLMIVVIAIAVKSHPQLLMENYYQESLDFDANQILKSELKQKGIEIQLKYNQNNSGTSFILDIGGNSNKLKVDSYDLEMYRPSNPDLDFKIKNISIQKPTLNQKNLKSGKWKAKVILHLENDRSLYQWFPIHLS